ncbi:adenylate cyclase [Phyllobacterium sp. YR620]|uniref:Adenylate/guanylate cyclase domain-containing protein n=1 Tax=Phyllobacterium pellucidum TaxID=2740464 RepID=A0A849VXU6_9HYPH|nr:MULTISPECIES: adenylate/guanylate cyclase domain-containing protein [Phyllobacterium]NTS33644.1 adenylate/guanylate cyclase domain-containing protein [Phyllobacterium pellucidum]SDO89721.1 adenylate cyclase [Phyllobacterium sp. YR620]SFJ49198.1 adenylate cyclase [Phyllobacterium sp. CL33Tsu]
MSATQSDVSTILLDKVADWLTHASLAGDNLETIVRGFCERIAAAGLPIARVNLSFSMLHPLYDALGFTWMRATGMSVEGYRHDPAGKPERFLQSPYFYLLNNNLEHLRRRLDRDGPVEFPVLEELRQEGMTDYLAFLQPFGGQSTQGMMGSWSTDSTGGFSDAMIAALLRLQNHLAVAAKMAVLGKLADNMLTTYLGGNAGKRVLDGQIRRGDGETIRAALVMGDMRESTMLAEKEGRQAYIDTLNHFFDAIAAPFNRSGGEIMSFMGDGFLAVYPCGRHKDPSKIACDAALAAVFKAQARVAELNKDRRSNGLSDVRYGIGLHVGNVMFGNVGLKDRLTFSAFGSAVNEVQRLQVLTKKYSHEVIASQAFASYCGGDWTTLGEEQLRGVGHKVTVLLPNASGDPIKIDDAYDDVAYDGLSEAEQVMLLHRDAKTRRPLLEKFMQ